MLPDKGTQRPEAAVWPFVGSGVVTRRNGRSVQAGGARRSALAARQRRPDPRTGAPTFWTPGTDGSSRGANVLPRGLSPGWITHALG
jgi:hypothetical protein